MSEECGKVVFSELEQKNLREKLFVVKVEALKNNNFRILKNY